MYHPIDHYVKCEWCGKQIVRSEIHEGRLFFGERTASFGDIDRINICINCAKNKKHIIRQ